MSRRIAIAVFWVVLAAAGTTRALTLDALEPFVFGGRFQYATTLDKGSVPFPWNTTTQSSEDYSRFMLDLAVDTRYGDLYLKGAAVWDRTREAQIQKRFLFEQGDYLWTQRLDRLYYGLRLFANERRFITYDMIAPLLTDDLVASGEQTLGVRFDTRAADTWGATLLYSALGDHHDTLRHIGYVRGLYEGPVNANVSYLLDHPNDFTSTNHAVFKTELSGSYKQAYAILSYEQSGFGDGDVFFPGGSFDFGAGDVRDVLPLGGAVFAEARLTSLDLGSVGWLKLVYDYAFVGQDFSNDLGLARGSQETHDAAAFFVARSVDLNARLRYGRANRFYYEDATTDRWDGSIWGKFANGMDFWLRGSTTYRATSGSYENANYVDTAIEKRIKEIRSAVHVMWKDAGTIFSSTRFAWDGSLPLSPNWAFYWRFILNEEFDVGQMLFSRLSYRPNDRIFITFSYGREVIGNGPYLLEDQDIELSRFSTAQYRLFLRGDF